MERREERHGETDALCKKNTTVRWNLKKKKKIYRPRCTVKTAVEIILRNGQFFSYTTGEIYLFFNFD
jgi:hypothetical protein